MCLTLVRFYQGLVNVEKPGVELREKCGNIFRDVFIRLVSVAYFFYISLQSLMTCGWSVK